MICCQQTHFFTSTAGILQALSGKNAKMHAQKLFQSLNFKSLSQQHASFPTQLQYLQLIDTNTFNMGVLLNLSVVLFYIFVYKCEVNNSLKIDINQKLRGISYL